MLPRLRSLLAMLAAGNGPIPAGEMADRLRVSRRTVFRELAGLGSVLDSYGLEVGSKPGEGIVLEGPAQAKNDLLAALEKETGNADAESAGKRERQDRLFLALLRDPGRKLSAHADGLRVSTATISHDLGDLAEFLAPRGLSLVRRAGSGVFVEGGEARLRRAVLSLMRSADENAGAYPHPDILLDIADLAPELEDVLGWMTPQSRGDFQKYAAVAVQRLSDGHALPDAAERAEEFEAMANRAADVLGDAFGIRFPAAELAALEVELAACRPNVPWKTAGKNTAALAALAGEMAARFDPGRAALLRMDETLMDGLVRHLRTALVRLRNRIEIADPMLDQIARNYPDVLRRSRAACEALRPHCGRWLPESEVSLFAAHFAAGVLRLADRDGRSRPARIGVICVYGIGSSYLLASQVKRVFGGRVFVEVGWQGDKEAWRRHDLLVSTTALPDADLPVVVVQPILAPGDAKRIGEALEKLDASGGGRAPSSGGAGDFLLSLRAAERLFAGARGLLENVRAAEIPEGAAQEDLFRAAGRLFGGDAGAAEGIARALAAREEISMQFIPELGIHLLHCRTNEVPGPRFGVLRPAGGAGDAGDAAAVLFLPSSAPREDAEMAGAISAALVEREAFLRAVHSGGAQEIRWHLDRILGNFLFHFAAHALKGQEPWQTF